VRPAIRWTGRRPPHVRPAIRSLAVDEPDDMTGPRPAAAQGSLEDLARRAADGDIAAFARIVRLHNEDMTRVAFVIVGDPAAAAAATEAAWFSAWPGLRRKRTPEALGSWLCSLAAAEATCLAKRRDARGATALELDDRPNDLPPSHAADLVADDALASALARLDPADRALLALRHVAGLSMAEVSQAVRRSRPPVEARLSRLRDDLHGLDPPGSDPAELDRLLGQRLRAHASAPVRYVDADATARRVRAEESLERTRVVSVAIAAAVGVFVAIHPHIARLFFGR
jgi:RNA polymerase sigma-70 factor (ECF subfamily)